MACKHRRFYLADPERLELTALHNRCSGLCVCCLDPDLRCLSKIYCIVGDILFALQPAAFLDKFRTFSNFIWGRLNLDILWQWLPTDIRLWIGTFLGVMFLLALKRVVFN